jgi:uncharacterized membrane protein YtjA (UPF0391 family)
MNDAAFPEIVCPIRKLSSSRPNHISWYSSCSAFRFARSGRQVSAGQSQKVTPEHREIPMSLLRWAVLFLIIAGVAALFGFGGIAEGAAEIAKVLFVIFLVIFAILGMVGLFTFKKMT